MQTKKWYMSRTLWLSVLTSIVGILMAVSDSITESGGDAGIILTIVGVMNGLLRMVTHKAIK